MREAFEDFYKDISGHKPYWWPEMKSYSPKIAQIAWEAWQAALQHPEQLPVAWLHIHKNGQGVSFTKADALGSVKSLPLYTYPQIAGKETK